VRDPLALVGEVELSVLGQTGHTHQRRGCARRLAPPALLGIVLLLSDPAAGEEPAGCAGGAGSGPTRSGDRTGLAGRARADRRRRQGLRSVAAGREQTAEDVAGRVRLPVDQVLGALLVLDLGGWVRRKPGPVYVR